MSERSSVNGIIGRAQSFDGISSHITMAGSADGKLNFPEDGSYSISLWAYAETIDSAWHGLAGKGHRQYYLQFKCFPDLSPSWEFVEYQDQVGWEFSEHFPSTTPVNGQWFYLTGVRDGNRQMLYVNGEIAVDTILINWNELSRVTGGDFTIGCHLNPDSLPALHGFNFFKGKIDEVRVISSVLVQTGSAVLYEPERRECAGGVQKIKISNINLLEIYNEKRSEKALSVLLLLSGVMTAYGQNDYGVHDPATL